MPCPAFQYCLIEDQRLLSALVSGGRRGILMSLAVAVGQIGIGISGAIAGPTYTQYGYVSNSVLAAIAISLMALMVWKRLPEPEGDEVDSPAASEADEMRLVRAEA
ncbi:MAG: hypothetical protein KY432_00325, partial [Acidobacteria bacterium]|nr:hypothetical protein [Acidobacteriota bacterium]